MLIQSRTYWRIVTWPDKGPAWVQWQREETVARGLFAAFVAAGVAAALVEPAAIGGGGIVRQMTPAAEAEVA